MPDAQARRAWKGFLVGTGIILAIIAGIIYLVRFTYAKFFQPVPGVVSLAAYFVDDSGNPVSAESPGYERSHIKIKGDVSQAGQPVKAGNVRITVSSTQTDLFRQSIAIPFRDGHFETEDPAFRSIGPGMPIEIKSEVTASGLNETVAIHLNSAPPVDRSSIEMGLVAAVLVLTVVFFLAFTGRKTAWRNQTAIIFSYFVIAIFLAVPILAPVMLLRIFPNAMEAMIGAPAGLINTHTPNQPENETQWALNIGGYSYRVAAKSAGTGSNTTAMGNINSTNAIATQAQPAGPGASDTQPKPVKPVPSPLTAQNTGTTTIPSGVPQPAETSSRFSSKAPVVQVQGGLVIPLYVIILSVIGGAINMTRKVPGFQKEGEELDFNLARPISRVGMAVINLARPTTDAGSVETPAHPAAAAEAEGRSSQETIEEQAHAIEAQLEPLVVAQIQRNCDTDAALAQIRSLVSKMQELYSARKSDEPVLKFSSFEDWAASHPRLGELLRGSWRVELLNQYMYLISAPFLAIVTYYILDLLGLSKQGVVVLLSFCVGLISERIVSWILSIATSYLRTDTSASTPKKA